MKRNGGFTIVEVMVAMIIFAAAMLCGLSFFVYGTKSMVRSDEYSYALQLARNRIETVMSTDYTLIVPSQNVFQQFGIGFTCATSVYTSANKYKIVTTSVTWQHTASPQGIFLSTIMSP